MIQVGTLWFIAVSQLASTTYQRHSVAESLVVAVGYYK
jgi:hypothetical protein